MITNNCSYPLISSLYTFKGCCCDSKRAVLVFNSLNLISYLILIVLILASRSNIGAFWAFYIVGICVFSLAIAGAALYNRWLVAPAALWAEISLVLTIVFSLKGTDTVVVDGQVYQASPVVNIVLALIWQGLVAYVSFTVRFNSFSTLEIANIHAFVYNP